MTSKDKRKKVLKRLSKLKNLERKDKKKKRTKNKGSVRNNLYQEYSYQQKSRTSTYLLVLFIVLLLAAVGTIVYFFVIKPKLDKKSKCTKNEKNDCRTNEYLDDKKCECLPCEVPNPECGPNQYYDPNNLPYCRNSTKYTKDGKKMYSCQPCPTCPDGKELQTKCGGGKYDSASKNPCKVISSNDNKKSGGLSGGAIAGIVIGTIGTIVVIFSIYNVIKGTQTILYRYQNPRPELFTKRPELFTKNPVYNNKSPSATKNALDTTGFGPPNKNS